MEADQFGEHLEHAHDRGRVQLGGLGVDGAERAEERAVGQHDGHRDVALEAVPGGRVVLAEGGILGDMVDDDRGAALPDLVADGRLKAQLTARLEAEGDVILDCAGHPAVLGDARHGREAHSGGSAHHVEDRGHGRDALDRDDVVEEAL